MAKIAYLILCHKDPKSIIGGSAAYGGGYVTIHFDKSASDTDYKTLVTALSENQNVVFQRVATNAVGPMVVGRRQFIHVANSGVHLQT